MELILPHSESDLLFKGWVTGFVDGEGCFSISFVRQEGAARRKGYRAGFQVTHEFAVTQGAKSAASLDRLLGFFGIGQIIHNTRHDNHREQLLRYAVRRRRDLADVIIPFFGRYPLSTAKHEDFLKFSECVRLMVDDVHLAPAGLQRIAAIAGTMNRQKPRMQSPVPGALLALD